MDAHGKLDMYDATAIGRIATNLFYGWGYNFYRLENQLRSDDLLVRSQVANTLGDARKLAEAAEAAFRRERLPAPTRQQPTHDAGALADAARLEDLGRRITALAGMVRSLPVPENDRISQRHRREDDTLARLLDADTRLIGHAESLRRDLDGANAPTLLANDTAIRERIGRIEEALRERAAILRIA